MIYAISDLHGRYDLYVKMLEKINFSDSDTLYILGDIVDRGDEGLKIVLDIARRDNVIPIMGNHDLLALTILSNLDLELTPDRMEDMRYLIATWKLDGGTATFDEYKKLSEKDQIIAIVTMDSFRHYAELSLGEREFVLCHGCINDYSENRPLSDYAIADFAFYREDYCKPKFAKRGKFLVTGHTPTAAIEGAEEGRIYKNHDHIAIDCGAAFGYGLGCICLDTMEEFYVK